MSFTDPTYGTGPPKKDDALLAGEAHVKDQSLTHSTPRTPFEFALAYAKRGWRLFPLHTPIRTGSNAECSCCEGPACPHIGKHPRYMKGSLESGHRSATLDEGLIRQWWSKWPDANIGIVTGKASGLIVLDTDPRNSGDSSLDEMIARNGPLPTTPYVLTGGGGTHHYFLYSVGVEYIKCNKGLLGAGLDIKADGGYVVAPPSLHASGRKYTWEWSHDPVDVEMADLPHWLLGLLRESVTEKQKEFEDSFCTSVSLSLCSSVTSEIPPAVMDLIRQTLPPRPGTRRDHVLKFGRGIKIDLGYAGTPVQALKPWVKRWHELAWDRTSRTKKIDDTWFDFVTFWPEARFALNGDIADIAYKRALTMPVPECAKGYEGPKVRLLVSICKSLQHMLGKIPFSLSTHQAGRLLEIPNSTASKWLHGLSADGVLECVHRGTPGPGGRTNSAGKWRYIGD